MTSPGPEFGLLLVLDGMMALLTSIIVIKKDRKNILNQLIALSVFAFGIYFIPEGIIYILPLTFQSWFNLLLDITLTAAIIGATIIALSGIYIWKGPGYLTEYRYSLPIILIGSLACIGASIDSEMHYDQVGDALSIEGGPLYMVSLFLVILVFIAIAMVTYYKTLQTIDKNDFVRVKLYAFILSLVLIICGLVYYAILETISTRVGILGMIGHIFYSGASLILIYVFGLTKRSN